MIVAFAVALRWSSDLAQAPSHTAWRAVEVLRCVEGKAPKSSVHPLVSGPARHLDQLGCWSQLRADLQSCRVGKQLAHSHGHRRLDWIVLLDLVASEAMGCWTLMAVHVAAPPSGTTPPGEGTTLA